MQQRKQLSSLFYDVLVTIAFACVVIVKKSVNCTAVILHLRPHPNLPVVQRRGLLVLHLGV